MKIGLPVLVQRQGEGKSRRREIRGRNDASSQKGTVITTDIIIQSRSGVQ